MTWLRFCVRSSAPKVNECLCPDLDELLARVRSAAELLERMEEDRAPLEQLPAAERERLQRAVAAFYLPDPVARRRRLKAAERERAAERVGACWRGARGDGNPDAAAEAGVHYS